MPVIGAVPGVAGAYVATGHSVWGILNAPATGEAMAELITEGKPSRLDLDPFSPTRPGRRLDPRAPAPRRPRARVGVCQRRRERVTDLIAPRGFPDISAILRSCASK